MEILDQGPVSLSNITDMLARTFSLVKGKSQEQIARLIMSLLSLVSIARSDKENIITIEEYYPKKTSEKTGRSRSSHDCPYCNASKSLTIVGRQAASLCAVALHQIYSSPFNRDKKAIAFSDSVQDASHRAGFFGARTYQFNLRIAVLQFLLARKDVSLKELPGLVTAHYVAKFGKEKFFSIFCAPGLEGLEEFHDIIANKKKSISPNVLTNLEHRLAWDMYKEFGSRTRIGRTLENTGSAVCYVESEAVNKANTQFHLRLTNEIGGFKKLSSSLTGRFIRGFLYHIRIRGGIISEDTRRYIQADGFGGLIGRNNDVHELLPRKRSWGDFPNFLCKNKHKIFDTVLGNSPQRTWYGKWAIHCFKSSNPLVLDYITDLYDICLHAFPGQKTRK